VRDVLSYLAGLAVIAHEVFWPPEGVDPTAVGAGLVLAGLPLLLGEVKGKDKDPE
jgi:hypothetical protein